jgi:hypothetical protein
MTKSIRGNFSSIAKRFIDAVPYFGVRASFNFVVRGYMHKADTDEEKQDFQHRMLKEHFRRMLGRTMRQYRARKNTVADETALFPIWVFWWQGEDNMPNTVKACYNALRQNAAGHPVQLVTSENYGQYADIPQFIMDKVSASAISVTHLSDIMRMCLLYENGGMWLDATILLTGPLPEVPEVSRKLGFWTPKDNGEGVRFLTELCNYRFVPGGRWNITAMYMNKGNVLAELVRALIFEYIEKRGRFGNYYFLDYLIAAIYDELPAMREMIDAVPADTAFSRYNELVYNLNNAYDNVFFEALTATTAMHKLTYKGNLQEHTNKGSLTNYGHVLWRYMLSYLPNDASGLREKL